MGRPLDDSPLPTSGCQRVPRWPGAPDKPGLPCWAAGLDAGPTWGRLPDSVLFERTRLDKLMSVFLREKTAGRGPVRPQFLMALRG